MEVPVTKAIEVEGTAAPYLVAAVASGYPVRASSEYDSNHTVANCLINSEKSRVYAHSWCASENDDSQWIQVCLGSVKRVVRIATKGRYDNPQWVTQYKVHYSCNGIDWSVADSDRVFHGNQDVSSVVSNEIMEPFFARTVRLVPIAWHNHISMKFEVYFED